MAMASSTVPRLGARWPPFFDTTSIITLRISEAKIGSSDLDRAFKSAGELILSRKLKGNVLLIPFDIL
jgi:hypothetical protein